MRLFAPIDLASHANISRQTAPGSWHAAFAEALGDLPGGDLRCWGVPFTIAGRATSGGAEAQSVQCWVALGAGGYADPVALPLDEALDVGSTSPSYLIFLHVCGLPATVPDSDALPQAVTHLGERLADYVLVYAGGSEHRQPIRWRFEVSGGQPMWGQRPFASRPNQMDAPLDFRGPYSRNAWGRAQTSVQGSHGRYWVYALANPHPDRPLRALRFEPSGASAALAIGAVTRFYGREHPLRHRQLESFRVTLPPLPDAETVPSSQPAPRESGSDAAPEASKQEEVPISIDLGIIARKYAIPAFDPDAWLAGEGIHTPLPHSVPAEPVRQIILDLTATADATLTVADHAIPLRPAYETGTAESDASAPSISAQSTIHDPQSTITVEVLTPHRTWLHVRLEDPATGRPAPGRVHFRAPDGRYLPPYGFRHEVNDNWFEDYGADLKLHGTQYAYVDGSFQIDMPVGDVFVEVFRGFEHRPLRRQLTIQPGQRSLTLATERPLNWRRRNWVTADTHVHFISPQTAWLQGQAEGLNLINLLASQWGDLYTNVGDISGGLSGVSRDETLIYVGTENRQHLLGHMSLLGVRGEPVFPMTTAGVDESYLGDPTWNTLAEWADEARSKDGVVVIPHFPNPYCEVTADILLGKIDAVELNMSNWAMQLHEWYRYLNCGYRVAAVGGTDKMGAYMPVGAIRTYALLDDEQPFSFEGWAGAVRAGRTFTTTGPLLDITVEGRSPGDELPLPTGGGTLHVEARAESVVPFEALEVVINGHVVASEPAPRTAGADGTYRCAINVPVQVPGSAWIAARCESPLDRWIGSPRQVAAHTSPVYVVAGGEELFSPSDATFMLTLLEGGLTWLDTLSVLASPERHVRNRKVFENARAHLHQRLHAGGRGHEHGAGHQH